MHTHTHTHLTPLTAHHTPPPLVVSILLVLGYFKELVKVSEVINIAHSLPSKKREREREREREMRER